MAGFSQGHAAEGRPRPRPPARAGGAVPRRADDRPGPAGGAGGPRPDRRPQAREPRASCCAPTTSTRRNGWPTSWRSCGTGAWWRATPARRSGRPPRRTRWSRWRWRRRARRGAHCVASRRRLRGAPGAGRRARRGDPHLPDRSPRRTNPAVVAALAAAGAAIVSVTCTTATLEDVYATALGQAGGGSRWWWHVSHPGSCPSRMPQPGGAAMTWLIARRAALESLQRSSQPARRPLLRARRAARAARAGHSTTADSGESGSALGARLASNLLMVGVLPAFSAVGIAAGQFAGEKERGILTPLLASPASNLAIFGGKVLGAIIPPLGYAAAGRSGLSERRRGASRAQRHLAALADRQRGDGAARPGGDLLRGRGGEPDLVAGAHVQRRAAARRPGADAGLGRGLRPDAPRMQDGGRWRYSGRSRACCCSTSS